MPPVPVIGVDPGARHTGVVARVGEDCRYAAVVTREGEGAWPDAAYLREVLDAVAEAAAAVGPALVAVEGVVTPSPHLGLSNPSGIIGAAIVLGAVLTAHPDAVVVRPGKYGSYPLASYPGDLVGARETAGTGKRRHARSAWDIAEAGWRLAQVSTS